MGRQLSRREFIGRTLVAGAGFAAMKQVQECVVIPTTHNMKFGLVTYQWGKDWDLPTLIANCEKAGYSGVEVRTEHAHGVETSLTPGQRATVKKRFADSPVKCVGYGSNYEYHSPDPAVLRQNIEGSKEYVKLCYDIGASGLKVKPNNLPQEVPQEKTIEQIARSLNEVGRFARDYGQLIRVEVHGTLTQQLPNMKAIFDQVTEPNVKICWNGNDADLLPPGLEANFNMVSRWIGDTTHIRGIKIVDYPYEELFRLFAGIRYNGWILLEATAPHDDTIVAMKEQLALFNAIISKL
jgi:sugar phosphate isomerase/epimerase